MENAQCYQGMLFMICTALTCTLIPIYTVVYMHHRSDIQSIRKIGGGLKLLHVLSERMDSEWRHLEIACLLMSRRKSQRNQEALRQVFSKSSTLLFGRRGRAQFWVAAVRRSAGMPM